MTATAGDASVRVNWTFTATPNPGDWEIEYGVHPSGTTSTVTEFSSGARSRTITGLTNATTYRFRVRGITTNVTQWSGWVTATPQAAAPSAPTGLTVTPGNAQLSVTWTAPSGTVTGYDVHYTSSTTVADGATVQSVSAAAGWLAHPTRSATDTSTSQTISSLMNGTPYRVRVRAKNTAGDSAWVEKSGTPSNVPIWSATLTVKGLRGALLGCLNSHSVVANKCSTAATLSNDGPFTVGGTSYSIVGATVSSDITLTLRFNAVVNSALGALKYCVGTSGYALAVGDSAVQWIDADGFGWSAGNTVSLSIGTSCPQVTRSTNANLSGLTAGSSTSSGGQYTDFSIGTFGATTTTYTATVANDQTHVKLTPTVADTGKAMVGVRKGTSGNFTPVTDGTASSAIALDVGANTLVVRVTAEDTTTTKDYTVTVTRQAAQTLSTNANLSGLTVGSSSSSTGTFTDFSIGTFGAATTTYTATVANDQTHVKLTPTVADTGKATVGVRKGNQGNFTPVTSGSASGAIALDVGANTLVVRVTAEDTTTTKDYTVTVTRRAAQTLSTNANLSGLTAGSSTSSTGQYTNFSIGTFGASTTTYTASVANDQTHVKLTPTVADTGKATVTVAGNTVTSGQASGPIALNVGSNAITVRVTAEDTTTTKDYTVTVTRQPPVPAKVTTAVSGTMTVGDGGSWKGFRASPSVGQLSDADFTYVGVGFRILGLRLNNSGGYLYLHLNKALDRNWGLVLNVGDSRFRIADAAFFTGPGYEGVLAGWGYSNQGETPPSWTVGQSVPVSLGTLTSSTVKLSVRPNPVNEGSSASVEACLSAVPQGTARIPVTLSHGTSEAGDWGVSLTGDTDGRLPISTAYSIAISGWLQRGCGTVNIPTHRDSDLDDETFTVALDTANLPPGVRAGSPASVQVRIKDLTDLPEVTLRAVRRTVAEGSPVELQAALTKPLATDVEIPLRVRWVTSETADHGFIRSITIAAGATTGSGTIRTHEDDDTDDERFQVAVIQPDLPPGVAPGSPSTVGVTIVDAANARLRALDLNTGN